MAKQVSKSNRAKPAMTVAQEIDALNDAAEAPKGKPAAKATKAPKGKPAAKATKAPKAGTPHRARFAPEATVKVLQPKAELPKAQAGKFAQLLKARTVGDFFARCEKAKLQVGNPFLHAMVEAKVAKIG